MNSNRAEYAAELRREHGCNCCQAVAVALADETKLPEELIKQIASGFGGGMGTTEATCGALIGAGIIAGLKDEGVATLKDTRQILKEFQKLSGAVICKELKGIETGKVLCACEDCVKNAVHAYETVMAQKQ